MYVGFYVYMKGEKQCMFERLRKFTKGIYVYIYTGGLRHADCGDDDDDCIFVSMQIDNTMACMFKVS